MVERALILCRGSVLPIAEALGKVPSRKGDVPRASDTMRATERTHILEVRLAYDAASPAPGQKD